MKKRIHAIAGMTGFLTIALFWTATAVSELFGSAADIATVKTAILWGMIVLIPALIVTGGSGFALGRNRAGPLLRRKQKRMPFIALNGLLILVPSAVYLAAKASAGELDTWFYGIQAVELAAGALNLVLIGLNIRDGLKLSGRIGGRRGLRARA